MPVIVDTSKLRNYERERLHRLKDDEPRKYLAILEVMRYEQFPTDRQCGEKLDPDTVQLIRFFIHMDIPLTRISQALRVGYYTIRDIKNGRTWSHLPYEPPQHFNAEEKDATKPLTFYFTQFKDGGNLLNYAQDKLLLQGVTEQQAREYLAQRFADQKWELEVDDMSGVSFKMA